MRILCIADVPLGSPSSGSEQVLYHQARGLQRVGFDVCAITRQNKAVPAVFRNVDGVRESCYSALPESLPRFARSLLREPSRLYDRFAAEGRFDTVICHQPFTCGMLLFMGKLRKIPSIYVFHSPLHEEYLIINKERSMVRNILPALARRMLERYCTRHSAKIMVLSDFMKQRVIHLHGIHPERIILNPGGADIERYQPPADRARLKRKLGFPEGKIHLLTVRRFEPRMGLGNLIKCMQVLVKERGLGIHLIMGGKGSEEKKLKNLIHEYGLEKDISMAGFIPSDLLPEYYGAADIFVLPTQELEGFGLITPESMACGTPVIGTPVGGTVEILSRFGSEFLFNDTSPESMAQGIGNIVETVFNNREEYEALRRRCRRYIEKEYSWKRNVDQLQAVIEGLVAQKKHT